MLGSKEPPLLLDDRRGVCVCSKSLSEHSLYILVIMLGAFDCFLQLWPSTVSATIHMMLAQTILAELILCSTKSTAMWQ